MSLGGVLARIFLTTIVEEIYIFVECCIYLAFWLDGLVVSGRIFSSGMHTHAHTHVYIVYSTSAILCLD